MLTRLRNRERGFTLIELLIVVAIIGIIAALLIPNFLDALQKAKQKRTVADARNTGTAMFSWVTDAASAAAAGAVATIAFPGNYGTKVSADDVAAVLVSQYIQSVPVLDGWKTPYEYYFKTATPLAKNVMGIRSYGRPGETGTAVADGGGPFTVTGFDPTDYERDIIWCDGFFVRWPQRLGGTS
jgi:prepilin-type N-terminal cleavage/methylation domain-containing protein